MIQEHPKGEVVLEWWSGFLPEAKLQNDLSDSEKDIS